MVKLYHPQYEEDMCSECGADEYVSVRDYEKLQAKYDKLEKACQALKELNLSLLEEGRKRIRFEREDNDGCKI